MTDIKLTPSSVAAFTEALKGESGSLDAWLEVNDESEVAAHIEAYASACVARATAEKDAEIDALRTRLEDTVRDSTNKIEALRAEVDSLQQQYDERTACTIVHRGTALACSDAVRAAYYEQYERAKRLDAALRNLLDVCEDSCDFADLQGRGTQREADAMDKAYKAREQESNDA